MIEFELQLFIEQHLIGLHIILIQQLPKKTINLDCWYNVNTLVFLAF